MQTRKKVAIFDSGVGGLTVLKTAFERLQGIDFFYLADKSNMPYGNASIEQMYQNTYDALQVLKEYKIDILVLACNTVTTNCIDKLRTEKDFNFTIFGVEPAIFSAVHALYKSCKLEQMNDCKSSIKDNALRNKKPFYLQNHSLHLTDLQTNIQEDKSLLLLATERTLKSKRVQYLLEKSGKKEKIFCYASRQLAAEIEKNCLELEQVAWAKYLPQGEFCGVILGCTHYIHIRQYIQKYYQASCFDGNIGTINHIQKCLTEIPYFVENGQNTVQFIGNNADFYQKIFQNMQN